MPDNTDPKTVDPLTVVIPPGDDDKKQADKDLVEKLVNERLEENLRPIKEKLDKAFEVRDKALEKVKEFEQKQRDEELKRLESEGKHQEAFEMRLAEERAEKEILKKKNVELTRDVNVRNVLATLDLRNDRAMEMAYQDIVGQLVQNEQGTWVHRSGISVKDFVKTFAEDESNSFLFKSKISSGSGNVGPAGKPVITEGRKSLFDMTQAEVLKLAGEGKLRQR